MGKVTVKTKLWNFIDEMEVQRGLRLPEEIRSVEVEAVVDTAATMLSLPADIVEKLGLPLRDEKAKVRYANNVIEEKEIARAVSLEILGRGGEFDALVEVRGTEVLIGQIILERLDLIPDPKRGTIGPRPESPDMPLIEML